MCYSIPRRQKSYQSINHLVRPSLFLSSLLPTFSTISTAANRPQPTISRKSAGVSAWRSPVQCTSRRSAGLPVRKWRSCWNCRGRRSTTSGNFWLGTGDSGHTRRSRRKRCLTLFSRCVGFYPFWQAIRFKPLIVLLFPLGFITSIPSVASRLMVRSVSWPAFPSLWANWDADLLSRFDLIMSGLILYGLVGIGHERRGNRWNIPLTQILRPLLGYSSIHRHHHAAAAFWHGRPRHQRHRDPGLVLVCQSKYEQVPCCSRRNWWCGWIPKGTGMINEKSVRLWSTRQGPLEEGYGCCLPERVPKRSAEQEGGPSILIYSCS